MAGANFGAPFLLGRLSRWNLDRRARRAKAVVLTFDDGPGERMTPAILQVLAEQNIKATFFLLGQKVAGREEVVRQIRRQGHEVCSHGYSHRHMWTMGPWRAIRDIVRGWHAIDAVWGDVNHEYSFRPPYGKLDLATLIYLWLTGTTVHYWTVDSTDTWDPSATDWKQAAETIRRNGGGVILVHDFDRSNPDIHRAVLEFVTEILNVAREDGLRMMTLSELMGSRSRN
jgi:peptidoglycan/xylan/chitin deacetylase (PgdA/CDA1 family)